MYGYTIEKTAWGCYYLLFWHKGMHIKAGEFQRYVEALDHLRLMGMHLKPRDRMIAQGF